VAQVLLSRLRSSDVVARIGGDEFAALLPDTDASAAHEVGDDLCRHVAAAAAVDGTTVTITVGSAGIVPTDRTPSELMSRADEDLYARKPSLVAH
jgi:diguanylate cyclase (GGDEF)-like protein